MFEHFVYIIKGINQFNKTKYYIGYTCNIHRRIRQHNCELVGGAKATKGYKWEYYGIITNFRDHIEGLQIEWRLKHSTKKTNIVNRINSFLQYIDTHNNASPKNKPFEHKLLFYLSPTFTKINDSINAHLIFINLDECIIEHIAN